MECQIANKIPEKIYTRKEDGQNSAKCTAYIFISD